MEEKKDNIGISNPVFTFIYTINLDGRINMLSNLQDMKNNGDLDLIKDSGDNLKLEPLKEYFITKEKFFNKLLEGGCNLKKKCGGCNTKFQDVTDTNLSHFVDKDFIQKAILGCWTLNENHLIGRDNEERPIFSKQHFTLVLNDYKDKYGEDAFVCDLENLKVLEDKVEIKLFSNGSISILVHLKLVETDITPEKIIKLIQLPNLVVRQQSQSKQKKDQVKEQPTGFLNYLSYDIANNVFNTFFKCLEAKKTRDRKRSLVDYLKIERVKEKENVEKNIKKSNKDPSRYTILQRYKKEKYTDNNYIQAWPYVGVVFGRPSGIDLKDEMNDDDDAYKDLGKILVAIATQTEEFLHHFKNPVQYLKQNSITRGSQDAMMLERRGFVACGIRPIDQNSEPDDDLHYFLRNTYTTLVFTIELTLASTKSVNAFHKELEEYVSPEVNNMLHTEFPHKYNRVKELNLLVARARALSPCEDFSSNLIPHLRSQIAIEGAKRIQDYSLNKLIETVHNRLDNYGHFLKTEHEELIISKNRFIARLSIFIALIALTFTIIKLFTSDFTVFNSNLNWFLSLF